MIYPNCTDFPGEIPEVLRKGGSDFPTEPCVSPVTVFFTTLNGSLRRNNST